MFLLQIQLIDLLQIAVDVHYVIKPNSEDPKDKSPGNHAYTSMCFDPLESNKIDDDVNTQNIEFVLCSALDSITRELSMMALEVINVHKFDKLIRMMHSSNSYL